MSAAEHLAPLHAEQVPAASGAPSHTSGRPPAVVRCDTEADISQAIRDARTTGRRLVPRGGGHCFAGRSTTDGVVLDLGGLREIRVDRSGAAVIGAGCLLGEVYAALHASARTLPAGCGATVGIAGLTLGGGIGLLGRRHGLTCDRLTSARVVLADGEVVECDEFREPELFWALRGAGGGQFGVVSSFTFATIVEPLVTRIEMSWPLRTDLTALLTAWQRWAPDAADALTVDLVVERAPGTAGAHARATGVSMLPATETVALLREFTADAASARVRALDPVPYSTVKEAHADERRSLPERPSRLRSEFFEDTMDERTADAVLSRLLDADSDSHRRLSFTAMGGAYNRMLTGDTAFAHRRTRFLLEHVGDPADPWIDESWRTAHAAGTGRVYPNFPDPLLEDPLTAYHGDNADRLSAVKQRYDPHRFFDFPQAVPPALAAGAVPHRSDRKEVSS